MNKKTQETARWRVPILLAGLGALMLAAAGAYLLLASGPAEQSAVSGERPYVGGHLHSLVVDPTDAEKVMVGGHDDAALSNDGGQTWRQASGLKGADPMGLVINPEDPSKMYAGGHPGFYRSGDGGESWSKENAGLPGTDIHGLGMNAENPDTLYAFIVEHGLYKSPDAGRTWELVNSQVGTTGPILVDPREPDTLYMVGEDGFMRSADGGKTFEQAGAIPGGMAMWISQDHQNPNIFYAAAGGRVVKSIDGGESWRTVGDDLPEGVSVVQVAQGDPRVVYAGALSNSGVLLFRSEDAGESWEVQN